MGGLRLTDPITSVKGIGEKTAEFYYKMNVYTVYDLLTHYPRDYEEWKDIVSVGALQAQQVQAIRATVIAQPQTIHVKKMSITTVHVKDATGQCDLIYFNMPFMKNALQAGKQYIFRGQVVMRRGVLTMEHPKVITPEEFVKHLGLLSPVYPTTKGLTSQAISKAIRNALDGVMAQTDYLPLRAKEQYQLKDYMTCLRGMHFPENKQELVQARKRLVFEEFLFFIISVMTLKDMSAQELNGAPMMRVDACEEFIQKLPYQLTNAQKKVWREIEEDLSSNHLMNRLVQGDVGSGKTIVAILAIFMCVMNHKQAAFMAPTEVLAKQHYESIMEMAKEYNLPFKPVLLTGSLTAKEKRLAKERIQAGTCNVIVGTQALIQDNVDYYDLKLVITDEQHRFGVKQRETLAQKGIQTHVLVMSATPIPRTLALILYGDLAISVMDELPANRLPIKNCVVNTDYRKKAYEFIEKEVAAGRQAYVICPMVEESESADGLENVIDYTGKLQNALPDSVKVAYLHGQMKPKEKNAVMEAFAAKEIDVLVSTTVIEVGINVPNATVMMVENAERFGLAQLHQLRGRVGRGKYQSYCIFVANTKQENTLERLQVLNKSNDGFFISSEDMRLRGPGDLFGIRQSGQFQFKLGDIYQDAALLQNAQECAYELFADYEKREDADLVEFWKHYDKNVYSSVDFISI